MYSSGLLPLGISPTIASGSLQLLEFGFHLGFSFWVITVSWHCLSLHKRSNQRYFTPFFTRHNRLVPAHLQMKFSFDEWVTDSFTRGCTLGLTNIIESIGMADKKGRPRLVEFLVQLVEHDVAQSGLTVLLGVPSSLASNNLCSSHLRRYL